MGAVIPLSGGWRISRARDRFELHRAQAIESDEIRLEGDTRWLDWRFARVGPAASGDAWEIAANKGSREASIELKRESGGTEVEIEISWPANDRGASSSGSGADDSGPGG